MRKDILERYPSTNIKVYAVWFSMVPTDARSSWSWIGGVLNDARVVHFWDENKTIGKWYAQYDIDYADNGVVWDAYYLYGPEAQWGSSPPKPIVMGATVIDRFDDLKKTVVPLLK